MEILKQYDEEKEGNDCIIRTNICILKCNCDYYVVVIKTYSGWMGNETDTRLSDGLDLDSAEELFKEYQI